MHRRVVAGLMVATVASLHAQTPQGSSAPRAFETDLAKVTWMRPSKTDSSAQYAILRTDSVSGATQMLWRFRPNVKGPCEWHAASQSIVVVQGSVTVQHAGATGTTLGAGGFAFMPKNSRFQLTAGSAPTIVFATLEGRPDFHPVSGSECPLSVGAAHAQDVPVPDSLVPQRHELLRADRFTVYLLDIPPGQATPMHRHDLDIASVFFNTARTVSTFWQEAPRSDPQGVGTVRFRAAGFTHATANTDTSRFLDIQLVFAHSQGRPDSTATGRRSDCSQSGPSTCEATTLFCLKDACVLDVTVAPRGVWRATAPVLVVPVTSAVWSTPGSSVVSPARMLPVGTALYEPTPGMRWQNEGAIAARLIAFEMRPNTRPN